MLLTWAREGAEEFDSVATKFLEGDVYTDFIEVDPETGNQIQKLRFFEGPDVLRRLAHHVITDLKHALDQATAAACAPLLRSVPDTITFPSGTHPNNMKERLEAGPYPVELHEVFMGFEPYPTGKGYAGGSNGFAAFSKMANNSKHVVALSVVPIATVTRASGQSTGFVSMPYPGSGWDPVKNELELATFGPEYKGEANFEFACFITFRDVDALKGQPASNVMHSLCGWVGAVIQTLEEALIAVEAMRKG